VNGSCLCLTCRHRGLHFRHKQDEEVLAKMLQGLDGGAAQGAYEGKRCLRRLKDLHYHGLDEGLGVRGGRGPVNGLV
jgi:hypothetical protein